MKVINISDKEKQKRELYKMLKVLPKPPIQFKLNAKQKFWWNWVGLILIESGNFAQLDLIHLQRAAYWLDVRTKMIEIQNYKTKEAAPHTAPAYIQTFNSGAQQISVYSSLIEKADKALNEISSHFGLSIRDRNKLSAPKDVDPDQTTLFEQFLNQKQM